MCTCPHGLNIHMLGIVIPVYRPANIQHTIGWVSGKVSVPHKICVVEHYREIPPQPLKDVKHITIRRLHPWPERGTGSRVGIEHFLKDNDIKVITELDADCTDDIQDINDCYNSIIADPHVIIKSRRLITSTQDRPLLRKVITNTFGTITGKIMRSDIQDWSYTHRYYPTSSLTEHGLPGEHLHTHMWNMALLARLYKKGVKVHERTSKVKDRHASSIGAKHIPRYLWEYCQAIKT